MYVSCKHGQYSKVDLGLVYNPFHFLHSLYLTTLQNFILNKNLNPPIFLHTAIDNSKFISIIYFVRIFKFIQNEYATHEGLNERYSTSNKLKLKVLKIIISKRIQINSSYIKIIPFCTFILLKIKDDLNFKIV